MNIENKQVNIDLDELQENSLKTYADTIEEDSGLMNELTEEDLINSNASSSDDYKLSDKNRSIFSPQIEVFEPFAAHVDASRTNMSAKQILQTVTSKNNELPFILNKNYRAMTDIDSPFIGYADDDGVIIHSNESIIVIYYINKKKIVDFYVPSSKKLVNNALTIKYKIGQSDDKKDFKKGDIIFDYSGQHIDSHVPRIGYRTNIMYASFYGYTAEDAFVASESFAKRAVIDHNKKVFVPITIELKYLKNENNKHFYDEGEITPDNFANYFKIDSTNNILSEFSNVSNKNSKIFGKAVDSLKEGTVKKIKVHKINTKENFKEINKKYIYTPDLIKEIGEMYQRQTELKKQLFFDFAKVMKQNEAIALTNNLFSQWETSEILSKNLLEDIGNDYDINPDQIDCVLEVLIEKTEHTKVGDKFANMYAGKGVCSLILPDNLMPKDEHGNAADIIFNPLGLFGRNNWGTIFEIALGKIIEDIQSYTYGNDPSDTKARLTFVAEHFIKKTDTDYYNKIIDSINSFDNPTYWKAFKDDVKKGLYLFVGNFPNIPFKKYMDEFISLYEKEFNINISQKIRTEYSQDLLQYMRDRGFLSNIFTEDEVFSVEQDVYFGKNYWIKLFHTSVSKYNSISFASNHSKSTGEPPRGRAKAGGCHLSWQSSAGIIGHKENNYMLKELNTIKSVATSEKKNFIRKMLSDGKYILKDKYPSPVIKTLNNSLHMIGLKFNHIKSERGEGFYEDADRQIEYKEDYTDFIIPLEEGSPADYVREDNIDVCMDDENQEDIDANTNN